MIDLNHCNEWQHRDPDTGLVFPWYTKSFLDELVTWDLKDKTVFEYGAGASTLWWAKKSKSVYAIESNVEWGRQVNEACKGTNAWVKIAEMLQWFEDAIYEHDVKYDIVIVDCEPVEWRDRCITQALNGIKPGGKLIIDNWDQLSVWVPSNTTRERLAPYPVAMYKQEGHPDWQTAVFTIDNPPNDPYAKAFLGGNVP